VRVPGPNTCVAVAGARPPAPRVVRSPGRRWPVAGPRTDRSEAVAELSPCVSHVCALERQGPGVLHAVASLVAPPLCGVCANPCGYREAICDRCARWLARECPRRTILPCGLEVISAASYEGVARELVAKMKYQGRIRLAEVAAERMARTLGAARSVRMVSVPPSPARERARGFDSAYMLARLIEKRVHFGQISVCLARDDGPRQVGRRRAQRLADPPRVRLLSDRVRLSDEELWLVDDVLTTGATLSACATVLREAGARRLRALTFACADSPGLGDSDLAA